MYKFKRETQPMEILEDERSIYKLIFFIAFKMKITQNIKLPNLNKFMQNF